jgi:hypothetical protein
MVKQKNSRHKAASQKYHWEMMRIEKWFETPSVLKEALGRTRDETPCPDLGKEGRITPTPQSDSHLPTIALATVG